MAKYNAGFCNFRHCSRFSNSVSKFSSSKNSSSLVVTKLQASKRGNRDVVTQGRHKACAFRRSSVLPQNVFSFKKGWRSTPCFGSKSFKQIYPDRTFQNGKSHDDKSYHKQRGLHDKYRSYRCISNRTNASRLAKIPSLFMARSVLPVCNHAVWSKCGTKSVHKINETRNSLAKRPGCSNDNFSRRYTYSRSNSRNNESTRTHDYKSTRVFRVFDQLQKVNSCSNTENPLLGDAHRLDNDGIYLTNGKIRKYSKRVSESFEDTTTFHQANITSSRSPRIHSPSHLVSSLTLSPYPVVTDRVSTSNVRFRHASESLQRGEIRLDLVDKQSTITERKSYSPSDSRFDNLFGCIQNRMGSIMGDSSNRRPMEHSRVPGAYKHPGAQGSFLCPEVVYEGSEQEGDLSQNRQLGCSSISEQQGRYPLPSVTPLDTGDMEVVRDQTPLSFSSTCSRQEQCNCGRGISQNERPQRLEDRFDGYSAPNQGVPNRSLCVSPDTSTEQIRQLAARSGCDPCGRVHNELDKFDSVRFSAIQPNSRRPSQDKEGNGNIDIDCASMVSSTMVASVDRLSNRLPCLPGEQLKSPDRRIPPKDNPSSIPGSKIGRVENIRRHFETAGLSTTAINLLTKSVKTSTTKAYNCSWSQWSSWCEKRESHPVLAPVSEVLTFLAEQFAEGKQYRTINVLRSAISSAHVHVDSKPIGQHPLVVRLMRGVSICRPPQPRYQHTWNVAMVTEYLSRLGGNDNLSEKQLAQKLCMLMALTCPERSSILASLNIKYLKYFPEGVKFQHTIFRKRSHNGKLGESVFPKFGDTLLCPVACLSTYLDRTKKWRKDKTDIMQQNLFLSFKKPHKPVTSATLSRWLKEVIRQSGIKDIFGGHSVRSASTSTAKKAGLSIDIILDMADWTSPSTFNLFYYKPNLPVSYGTSVLSQK